MSKLEEIIEEHFPPCPENFVPTNGGSMTAEFFRSFMSIREMTCGPRIFFDASSGAPLTDHEILVRIFNGSRIEEIPAIPIPAGIFLLPVALFILWRIARGLSH